MPCRSIPFGAAIAESDARWYSGAGAEAHTCVGTLLQTLQHACVGTSLWRYRFLGFDVQASILRWHFGSIVRWC